MTQTADERPHRAGPGPDWEESYSFDWVAGDGSLGGYVRLGLRPGDGRAWWWMAVVGQGRRLVTVRDHDVELPRPPSLEVRAPGLWADLVCEAPLDHWSIGMEAFGVALDSPADVFAGEWGERVPVGLDLEWEASELPLGRPGGRGYDQGGVVHGDVLVGDERLAVDGTGARAHDWGPVPWWSGPHSWAAVRQDDGRWWHGPVAAASTADGLLVGGRTERGGLQLSPWAHAPVVVPAPAGSATQLARAMCRAGDGGWGWAEVLVPPIA